jgi:outer membrane lipoprotein-sorting protein
VAPLLDSGANQSDAETLIWIDEALQIPVRWETSSKSADRQTKTVMELSEISLEVDDRIFALPVDYKKVNSQALGLGNGNLTAAEATKGKN